MRIDERREDSAWMVASLKAVVSEGVGRLDADVWK